MGKQVVGMCALCGEHGALIDSHLLPKSAYKVVRDKSDDGQPIRIGGGPVACQTNEQFKQHLLCINCEDLLSKNGERLLGVLWATDSGFKLRAHLEDGCVLSEGESFTVYDPSKVPSEYVDALRYFVVSVLWRAQVWRWPYGGDPYRRALGDKYQNEFAEFLLGKRSTVSALFVVMVNSNEQLNGMMSLPQCAKTTGGRYHSFFVPGLRFVTVVGGATPGTRAPFESLNTDMVFLSYDLLSTNIFGSMARYVQEEVVVKGKMAMDRRFNVGGVFE